MTKIRPLQSGTRMREDHNTFAQVKSNFGPNDALQGQVVWTAPANGNEVFAGDQWLLVESTNGVSTSGWVAIIHKGVKFCEIILTPDEPPVEEPTSDPVFVDVDITVTGAEVGAVRVNKIPYTK